MSFKETIPIHRSVP